MKIPKGAKKLFKFDLKKMRRNMETMYGPRPKRSSGRRRRGY